MRENEDEKQEEKTTTARRCWDEGKRYKCLCMQWQWDLLAHTLNFPLLVRSHVCVSVCSYHVVCMLDSCVKHTRSRVMMCIALHLLGWNLNISINSLFKLYSEFGIHKHTHALPHTHIIWTEIHFSLTIPDDLRSRLHWWRWCHHSTIARISLRLSLEKWKFPTKNRNERKRMLQGEICMSFPQFYHQLVSSCAEYLQLMYVECWILVMIIFGCCCSPIPQNHCRFVFLFGENGNVDQSTDWIFCIARRKTNSWFGLGNVNDLLIDLKISNGDLHLSVFVVD